MQNQGLELAYPEAPFCLNLVLSSACLERNSSRWRREGCGASAHSAPDVSLLSLTLPVFTSVAAMDLYLSTYCSHLHTLPLFRVVMRFCIFSVLQCLAPKRWSADDVSNCDKDFWCITSFNLHSTLRDQLQWLFPFICRLKTKAQRTYVTLPRPPTGNWQGWHQPSSADPHLYPCRVADCFATALPSTDLDSEGAQEAEPGWISIRKAPTRFILHYGKI